MVGLIFLVVTLDVILYLLTGYVIMDSTYLHFYDSNPAYKPLVVITWPIFLVVLLIMTACRVYVEWVEDIKTWYEIHKEVNNEDNI